MSDDAIWDFLALLWAVAVLMVIGLAPFVLLGLIVKFLFF